MVKYDAVLVPTDGSDGVEAVLDHALSLATHHEATLHALYVVDRRLSLAADDEDRGTIDGKLRRRGEEALSAVAARAEAADVALETAIREGVPEREILEYATEQNIDVVAMGTHGRTGRDRLSHLGSVTDRVVSGAVVPVFVVNIADGE